MQARSAPIKVEKHHALQIAMGFAAAERTGHGETRSFNPEAPEILFFPRLKGD